MVPYDRAVLVDVLVYHYRKDIQHCGCGWGSEPKHLGLSHPEHVATVYEQSVQFVNVDHPSSSSSESRDRPGRVGGSVSEGQAGDAEGS